MTTWDTGEIRARHRRRIRGPLTMLVLLGVLGGAAWFGYKVVLEDQTPVAQRVCATPGADGKQRIASSAVTVNVYNAGKTRGLGAHTAEDLEKRGFVIGKVTNAPDNFKMKSPKKIMDIKGRAKAAAEVQLVLAQFSGESFIADGRKTFDVDLYIGEHFTKMLEKAPKELDVKTDLVTCSTVSPTPTP